MAASMFEDLPEDPERIFLVVEQRFREDLDRKTEKVDWDQWFPSTDCMEYIRRTSSAAQELGLAFLLNYEVPSSRNLTDEDYRDFRGMVDHYITALHLRHARRDSGYTVKFDVTAKRKVTHFIQNIREIILKLEIDDWKREALLNRLNALQEEVDRDRFRYQVFAAYVIETAGVIGISAEKMKPARDLLDSIAGVIWGTKHNEQSHQLPAPSTPKQIPPPKTAEPRRPIGRRTKAEMDDDIPF